MSKKKHDEYKDICICFKCKNGVLISEDIRQPVFSCVKAIDGAYVYDSCYFYDYDKHWKSKYFEDS